MNEQLMAILPALRRFARSLTHSAHDADDLLQGTVERILRKGVPDDVELARWAFTVCRNLWIDEYRARRTRRNAQWDPQLTAANHSDGERDIHSQMALEEVDRAMQQLPQEQNLVLSMVAVQGLSYKRTAEELDIPVGTVMSRLARARARLTELLHTTEKRSDK